MKCAYEIRETDADTATARGGTRRHSPSTAKSFSSIFIFVSSASCLGRDACSYYTTNIQSTTTVLQHDSCLGITSQLPDKQTDGCEYMCARNPTLHHMCVGALLCPFVSLPPCPLVSPRVPSCPLWSHLHPFLTRHCLRQHFFSFSSSPNIDQHNV